MKKTIFLIRNIAPNLYGGGESYQIELAKVLKKHEFEPIIFSASERLLRTAKENRIKAINAPYIKQQNWSSWRNILLPIYIIYQIKLYFWYKAQIKKYHPVAMNIQSRDEWIAATLAGKKKHVKILWTDHIDFRTWVFQNIKQKFKNPIGKYILKLTKIPYKVIAITDFEAQWFEKNIKKIDNMIVIKNGVIDQLHSYSGVKPQKDSFCYVGRLIDYKGIRELIFAFEDISKKYKDATLNIYGEGPDEKTYRHLAKDNSKIIFHGFSNNPNYAIAESEVFVLPSYYEGLSIALLQATMLKKTIIASNIDGNQEVIKNGKTGLLITPKDTNSLKDAMETLIENRQFSQELAKNARRLYEENFDFEKTIEGYFLNLIA